MTSEIRPATADDNEALLDLATLCPMEGRIGLSIERSPEFLALNRLEGDEFRVGVIDGPNGRPIACVAVARQAAYVHGNAVPTSYVGDLKVHPDFRRKGIATHLTEYARETSEELSGRDAPAVATVLVGNTAMEKRFGTSETAFTPFATLKSYSIPLFSRFPLQRSGVDVKRASRSEVPEMAGLWNEVAPARQFARVFDAKSLDAWITAAPGLDFGDYLLARNASGRLIGFLGIWDQRTFKQTRVVRYSRSLGLVRKGFNAVAPLLGATALPRVGQPMNDLSAVHVCVQNSDADVFRSLLLHAYAAYRGRGYSFLSVGLDESDPLTGALRGLFAQTNDIWGCVLGGRPPVQELRDRPFSHEISLV